MKENLEYVLNRNIRVSLLMPENTYTLANGSHRRHIDRYFSIYAGTVVKCISSDDKESKFELLSFESITDKPQHKFDKLIGRQITISSALLRYLLSL